MMTSQNQVREAFWAAHPAIEDRARRNGLRSKRQNEQHAETRLAFIDFVDHLQRNGDINEALAQRVTL